MEVCDNTYTHVRALSECLFPSLLVSSVADPAVAVDLAVSGEQVYYTTEEDFDGDTELEVSSHCSDVNDGQWNKMLSTINFKHV